MAETKPGFLPALTVDQTPPKIGAHIAKFCKTINAAASPIYVDTVPDAGAKERDRSN